LVIGKKKEYELGEFNFFFFLEGFQFKINFRNEKG